MALVFATFATAAVSHDLTYALPVGLTALIVLVFARAMPRRTATGRRA